MSREKVDTENTQRVYLNAETELHAKIKKAARANRMTMGAYCLRMIEIGMEASNGKAV